MTDPNRASAPDEPRGEAPKWVPLAALGGLLLTLLFTTWYMQTEPPHYWKDAAVYPVPDAAPAKAPPTDATPAATEGGADAGPDGAR